MSKITSNFIFFIFKFAPIYINDFQRLRYYILILFSALLLFSECSQQGCPGGMCPPNHNLSYNKRVARKSMTFSSKKRLNLFTFRRVGTGWSRRGNQNKGIRRFHSIEDQARTFNPSKEGSYSSNMNTAIYNPERVKNKQSRYLNKKRIKQSRKTGHQEGLWSPELQNWKSRVGLHKKKAKKQKVKTIELD